MKKTFFNRIMITYSLIVCTLILLIFSGFIIYLQRDSQRELEKYNDESFLSHTAAYEQALSNMYYVSQNVKSINSLDLFALSSGEDYYRRQTEFYIDLKKFSSLITNGGYNVMVHKANDEKVITNLNTDKMSSILGEIGLTAKQYQNAIDKISTNARFPESIILTDNYLIYVSQKDYVDNKLIVTLYASLRSLDLSVSDLDMQILIKSDDPTIIDLREKTKAPEIQFSQNSPDVTADTINKEIVDGTTYKWKASTYLNMVYFYQYDSGHILSETLSLTLKMAVLLVAVCLLAFFIIAVFSVKLYRPIDHLINSFISFDVNEEMSPHFKNEIDYIAQQVMDIRKRNQELAVKLDSSTKILKDELLEGILHNNFNKESISEDLEKYGIGWMDEGAAVVLFDFSGIKQEKYVSNLDLQKNVVHMLEEQIARRYISQHTISYSGRVCFIIRQAELTALKEELNKIITIIDTAFQLPLSVYIGKPGQNLYEICNSYTSANRVIDNRHRLPFKSVYDFSDCEKLSAENVVYPIRTEQELINAVEKHDDREVKKLIDYIFAQYVERAFEGKETKEFIIFALINTINRALQQMGIDLRQITDKGELMFLELKMCETSDQLKSYVAKQFERILSEVKTSEEIKTNDFKGDLISYLRGNIQKDISLLDLAEHFSLSTNYMSALFKNTMDSNFKDYLSKARFERAVEILKEEPDIKLASLGEQVGVSNVNTLIRIFKKYSGHSPGQYNSKFLHEPRTR